MPSDQFAPPNAPKIIKELQPRAQIEPRFEGQFATEADLTLLDRRISRVTGQEDYAEPSMNVKPSE